MESGFELQLLSAFVDEALDPLRQLEAQARIEHDPVLSAEVQRIRRLRAAVRAHAERYAAPVGLYLLIRESRAFHLAEDGPDRFDWLRWFGWRPLVSSLTLVALALFGLNLAPWQSGRDERLMQAAVNSHLLATTGQRLVDIASADRRLVKPWLSTRLAFSAPVPESDLVGATLVGARVDSLEGRSVAALVYRLGDHVVDAFAWPTTDADLPIATASRRGLNVSHWSRGGMRYCVVSDLPQRQFMTFALALEKGDDTL